MKLDPWDLDLLTKTAAPTPGQRGADDFLRAVTPEDIDRLLRDHEENPDPRDRDFGVPTSGRGHEPERYDTSHYPEEGYNRPDRRYPGEYPENADNHGYHITHPLDDFHDEDDDIGYQPSYYHVVTGPIHSDDPDTWTEHEHSMLENQHADPDPDSAWEDFENRNHEYWPERNPEATQEVKHVHPADEHGAWQNTLRSDADTLDRVSQHGFENESNTPGQRAYTQTDPHGGVHRLWHTLHNPAWQTSYYDPGLSHEQQMPWSSHRDDTYTGDSLGDALERSHRNLAHADIMHSGTGLSPVENMYGHHYVSKRPDSSVQQLLLNSHGGQGENNWSVTHYSPDSVDMRTTEHGEDLPGALEQARRNLARG